MLSNKEIDELKSFESLWSDGYYEGDPLNPIAKSSYGQFGFISVLYATYLKCIKPYINDQTVSLEIGPGRGAWTKALLPSKEIYAIDALAEENNKFFEYLGNPKNVKYFQVKDFGCNFLPDNYFTYMFSFGCLCHVSFEGITKYAVNIFPKLKSGSHCFWMVADYDKFNNILANKYRFSYWTTMISARKQYLPLKWLIRYLIEKRTPKLLEKDKNDEPSPGRWYNTGIDRTCAMLQQVGYKIVEKDAGTSLRDPIIHFFKS
jgi:phospholipid N-methyltransferase